MKSMQTKFGWQRLADAQVPTGILWWIILGLWLRRREMDKAIDEFSKSASDLGNLLGDRWREGTEREEELLQLQQSIESLTRWLVVLTIVVGIVGLVAAAGTIWAVIDE
jgi:hypothetical protein